MIGAIGRSTRNALIQLGSIYRLLLGMVNELGDQVSRRRPPLRRRVLFEQTDRVGIGSIPLVAMVSFFIGLTMALLIGAELKVYGTERLVPQLIAIAFSRELGPLMTGIVLAARIGAAFTAELGTMTVSEEVEAVEAMGLGPLRFLVAPRLLAITGLLPCLVVISTLAAVFGSFLVSLYYLNIAPGYFFDLTQEGLRVRDVLMGIFKSGVFGLIIGLVACYRGLTVKGGAAGVGNATTSSVVTSVTTVIGTDTLFNILQQALLPNQ
ncbi:MAG: ABC transporter permease [Verrucomicrobia bacterium]|nr:ABC transporter permease [Verrucomicrobiota bacterium]